MKLEIYKKSRKPVSKDAAMIMSGGINYESTRHSYQHYYKAKPIPPCLPENILPDFARTLEKYIGIKRGRLTVTNWFGSWSHDRLGMGNGGRSLWLCRCSCGDYVTRRSRSFTDDNMQKFDACPDCENKVKLKKEEHFRKTGKYCSEEYYT